MPQDYRLNKCTPSSHSSSLYASSHFSSSSHFLSSHCSSHSSSSPLSPFCILLLLCLLPCFFFSFTFFLSWLLFFLSSAFFSSSHFYFSYLPFSSSFLLIFFFRLLRILLLLSLFNQSFIQILICSLVTLCSFSQAFSRSFFITLRRTDPDLLSRLLWSVGRVLCHLSHRILQNHGRQRTHTAVHVQPAQAKPRYGLYIVYIILYNINYFI